MFTFKVMVCVHLDPHELVLLLDLLDDLLLQAGYVTGLEGGGVSTISAPMKQNTPSKKGMWP